jgi:hypothetical protein
VDCPDALDLVGAAAGQVGGSAAVSPEARSATMLWWAAAARFPTRVFAGATFSAVASLPRIGVCPGDGNQPSSAMPPDESGCRGPVRSAEHDVSSPAAHQRLVGSPALPRQYQGVVLLISWHILVQIIWHTRSFLAIPADPGKRLKLDIASEYAFPKSFHTRFATGAPNNKLRSVPDNARSNRREGEGALSVFAASTNILPQQVR